MTYQQGFTLSTKVTQDNHEIKWYYEGELVFTLVCESIIITNSKTNPWFYSGKCEWERWYFEINAHSVDILTFSGGITPNSHSVLIISFVTFTLDFRFQPEDCPRAAVGVWERATHLPEARRHPHQHAPAASQDEALREQRYVRPLHGPQRGHPLPTLWPEGKMKAIGALLHKKDFYLKSSIQIKPWMAFSQLDCSIQDLQLIFMTCLISKVMFCTIWPRMDWGT